MAQKKRDSGEFDSLRKALSSGELKNLYIFYGEERYLLENYLVKIRKLLIPDGLSDFNYKRFNGGLTVEELISAVDTLPVFSERTLIEAHDFDIFKSGDEAKKRLCGLFSDLPEYVCLVFVYDTIAYSPDRRQKIASAIKQHGSAVEFQVQEQQKLIKWIKSHFADAGKRIDTQTAEYLAFITGGLMTALSGEIEKVSAYCTGESVTRNDIDAVVTPVLDAVSYKLTDAVAKGSFDDAALILDELLRMREPPHKLIFSISLRLRQLMAARVCFENGLGTQNLKDMCSIRFDFQAKNLMAAARRTSLAECRSAVIFCADTAFRMNSGGDPEALLTELLLKLAAANRAVKS